MNHTGNAISRPSPLSALSRVEWLCLVLVVLAHVLPVCWLLCGSVTDPPEMTPPIAGVLVSGSGGTGGGTAGRTDDGLPGHKARDKTTHDQGAASAPKPAMAKNPSRAERAMANRTAVSQTSPSVVSSVTQSQDAATTATDKNITGGSGSHALSGGAGTGETGNSASGDGKGSGTGGSGHGGGSGNGFAGPDGTAFSNPKPPYPAISRRMGEEGLVVLSVYILADGTVGDVSVKKSSGFRRLDESALKTVRRWRYAPAKRHGKPVAIRYAQPIRFSLND